MCGFRPPPADRKRPGVAASPRRPFLFLKPRSTALCARVARCVRGSYSTVFNGLFLGRGSWDRRQPCESRHRGAVRDRSAGVGRARRQDAFRGSPRAVRALRSRHGVATGTARAHGFGMSRSRQQFRLFLTQIMRGWPARHGALESRSSSRDRGNEDRDSQNGERKMVPAE